jgi:diacylglycerol O-acyltransferase / wax synthase
VSWLGPSQSTRCYSNQRVDRGNIRVHDCPGSDVSVRPCHTSDSPGLQSANTSAQEAVAFWPSLDRGSHMQRLSGLDSMFLSLESATNLFQVGAIAVLDPSTAPPGSPPPHEGLRRVIEQRLHILPALRQRVLSVPGGLDHPRWVEDEALDLDHHVIRAELPAPVSPRDLARYAAEVLASPLDRSRPLWEIHVVDGLEGGLVAAVAKLHHSAVDGIAGAEVTGLLMDLSPEVTPVSPPDRNFDDQQPTAAALVADAARASLVRIPKAIRTVAPLPLALARIAVRNRRSHTTPAPSPFDAPRTRLGAGLGARRSVGFVAVERHEVDRVRAATGVTVNDVILALSAGALRDHLADSADLPDKPLVAFVPVSAGGAKGRAGGTNDLSGMLVSLATTTSDPFVRLREVSESSCSAKAQGEILGPHLIGGLAELAVPALLGPVGRLTRALGVVKRRPPFNVIVSSFPGPRSPLFCAGAELIAYHPLGPIMDGAALNITAMSYRERIGFGLLACGDVLGDVDVLANRISESMRDLSKAVSRASM